MSKRRDIGRSDGIVAGSKRGGTQVARRIDCPDLPPPRIGFGCAILVTLNIILYQYFRFVCVVSFTPPAKQSAGPYALTTMPFWLGL